MVEEIVCPMLSCAKSLSDPQAVKKYGNMTREECIEDECQHYRSCWYGGKEKVYEIAEE